MFNNFSNKKLIIVFSVLLVVVVLMFLIDSNPNESTFKKDIIDINKNDITSILIYPKVTNHKEVKLYKQGNDWFVNLENGKTASVPQEKVDGLLDSFDKMKPTRIVTKSPDKWSAFQVDTSGTQVKVYEGDDLTLDIVIGRYTFKQNRTFSSYFKLSDENNVYEVDGLLSITFNQDANFFRNFHLLFDSYNNWDKVIFTYPGDSSFTMIKNDNDWFINGIGTDSAKTANYLNSLSTLSNSNFEDNVDRALLIKAYYTITIESKTKGTITISSFGEDENAIIHSSMRPEVYFKAGAKIFMDRTFVGKRSFFSN